VVQKLTLVKITDNSGLLQGRCISPGLKKFATVGDTILISSTSVESSKYKKGDVFSALIVRTKKSNNFFDGSTTMFESNAVVIVKSKLPLAKRAFGALSKNLRCQKFLRVLFLSKVVL